MTGWLMHISSYMRAVERAIDHVKLLFFGEFDEVDRVSRYANRELGIFLRVLHRVLQRFAIQYVDVDVEAAARKICVERAGTAGDAITFAAERASARRTK